MRVENSETLQYDRAFKQLLRNSGYHIVHDLVPLYHMIQNLSQNLSREAKQRLKWMDYYRTTRDVSLTARHFDISRKTFYKWLARYDPHNLVTLEDGNRAPIKRRQREITSLQESRIVALRKEYIRYGKEKLARIYERRCGEKISSWKVQKVIEKRNLYYHPAKTARIAKKRRSSLKKKRITELKKKKRTGFLICLDVIVIYWNGCKRYIFTAIDNYSKIAFARMYTSKSSLSGQDFLRRLYILFDQKIENLQTDNGSEFLGMFEKACQELGIEHYFSRVRTPDDNPVDERFNRTLQKEFVQLGNFTPDPVRFNRDLTEWLVEYDFYRPHQTLDYLSPIEFHHKYHKVLPMYSSSTIDCSE